MSSGISNIYLFYIQKFSDFQLFFIQKQLVTAKLIANAIRGGGLKIDIKNLTVASPFLGLLCFLGKRISLDLYSFSL